MFLVFKKRVDFFFSTILIMSEPTATSEITEKPTTTKETTPVVEGEKKSNETTENATKENEPGWKKTFFFHSFQFSSFF